MKGKKGRRRKKSELRGILLTYKYDSGQEVEPGGG